MSEIERHDLEDLDDRVHELSDRLALAYQIVGALLRMIGAFKTDEASNILDMLSEDDYEMPLPFPKPKGELLKIVETKGLWQ